MLEVIYSMIRFVCCKLSVLYTRFLTNPYDPISPDRNLFTVFCLTHKLVHKSAGGPFNCLNEGLFKIFLDFGLNCSSILVY